MSSVKQWLTEYVKADEPVIGKPEVDRRVGAMNDLFNNWKNMNGRQFEEVMTTAHFSAYFDDALSRMFYDAYQYKVGAWRSYTRPDTTPDFRDVNRLRMSEPGTLRRRREKGQARATSISPTLIQYGVDEFAMDFDVSWQTILNDDLGAIADTPNRMLNSALRFEDEFVSALYDNATTQAALVALGALYSGTGRLTEPNLATGITTMRTRTDAGGNKMNITGLHLVIAPENEIQAAKVLESAQTAGNAENDKNVIPRFIRGVHVDPYIGVSGANIPWYLVADPSEIPTITVARLQGWPRPIVTKKRSDVEMITGTAPAALMMGSFDTGDIVYSVMDVIGGWDDASYVGVTDYRGIYYSAGTTP